MRERGGEGEEGARRVERGGKGRREGATIQKRRVEGQRGLTYSVMKLSADLAEPIKSSDEELATAVSYIVMETHILPSSIPPPPPFSLFTSSPPPPPLLLYPSLPFLAYPVPL